MEPEMTILECIGQVVVFWAVCLVGWVTVKVIERRNRAAKLSHKCRKDAAKMPQKCRTNAAKKPGGGQREKQNSVRRTGRLLYGVFGNVCKSSMPLFRPLHEGGR